LRPHRTTSSPPRPELVEPPSGNHPVALSYAPLVPSVRPRLPDGGTFSAELGNDHRRRAEVGDALAPGNQRLWRHADGPSGACGKYRSGPGVPGRSSACRRPPGRDDAVLPYVGMWLAGPAGHRGGSAPASGAVSSGSQSWSALAVASSPLDIRVAGRGGHDLVAIDDGAVPGSPSSDGQRIPPGAGMTMEAGELAGGEVVGGDTATPTPKSRRLEAAWMVRTGTTKRSPGGGGPPPRHPGHEQERWRFGTRPGGRWRRPGSRPAQGSGRPGPAGHE
jgi:hypothetical protein